MGINFPDSPVIDEQFAPVGLDKVFTWNGVRWVTGGTGGPTPPADYVLKAGDTMTGVLKLVAPNPPAPEDAGHKRYIDESIAAQSLYQGLWSPAANTPDLTPSAAILHSYSWIAQTVDPVVPEIAPVGLPGIEGLSVGTGDTVIWNGNLALYELIKVAAAQGNFVLKTGDTMSGPLVMAAGSALRWDNSAAVTDPLDFSKGLCLYGYGGSSKFGFTITGGTLNYVVETNANKHSFIVGAAEVMRVNSGGATFTGDAPGISFNTVTSSGIFFNSSAAAVRFRIVAEDQHLYINAGGTGNCIDITRNGNVNLPLSNLSVNGRITINANQHFTMTNDGYGLSMNGGCLVYKKNGGGGILRESTGNTRWGIENNAGTWQGYISKQSTRDVGTVEELITNAIAPLLAQIKALEARLAKAKL